MDFKETSVGGDNMVRILPCYCRNRFRFLATLFLTMFVLVKLLEMGHSEDLERTMPSGLIIHEDRRTINSNNMKEFDVNSANIKDDRLSPETEMGGIDLGIIDVPNEKDMLDILSRETDYGLESNTIWNSAEQEALAMKTLHQSFFDIQHSLARSVKGSMRNPLRQFSTPCWIEQYQENYNPIHSNYVEKVLNGFYYSGNFQELYQLRKSRAKKNEFTHLRCLPAVYLGGVYKGGSTDLSETLGLHDSIIKPITKEPLLNLWRSVNTNITFEDYLQLMDLSAEELVSELERKKTNKGRRRVHKKLIYDGTVVLMHTYVDWRNQPWNEGSDEPKLIVAHHLRIANPLAKYIFMIREPVDWLESCFNYYHSMKYENITDEMFHDLTLSDIHNFTNCLEDSRNLRKCVFNYNAEPCSILNAVYYIYLRHWLEIIPRGQILVLKSENYFSNRFKELNRIFTFLNIELMDRSDEYWVKKEKPHNQKRHNIKLLDKTRNAVRHFIEPWNTKLAILLQNVEFLWR